MIKTEKKKRNNQAAAKNNKRDTDTVQIDTVTDVTHNNNEDIDIIKKHKVAEDAVVRDGTEESQQDGFDKPTETNKSGNPTMASITKGHPSEGSYSDDRDEVIELSK